MKRAKHAPVAEPGERPWYRDGLGFACTGCGRCCTGASGYVWVSLEEIGRLADHFGLDLDDFGRRYLRRVDSRYALINGPGGDCVFLRGKSCAVYDERPAQCRAFPWWPVNLASAECWQRAAQGCEGITDTAPRASLAVIEPALAAAKDAGLTED